MRISAVTVLGFAFAASLAVADDWTREQQAVIDFEKECISTQDAAKLKSCFHEDYAGWGLASPVPLTKSDSETLIDSDFESFERQSLLFKPLSVIVKGDTAVVSYIDAGKTTDRRSGEVEYYTQRWTDVLIREGGRWYWISDHGSDVPGE